MRRILLLFVLLSACTPAATEAPSGRRLLALLHLADLHSHLFPERVTLTARDVARGLGSGRGGALRDGAVGGSDLGDADARDAAVGDSAVVGGAARIATLLDQERARADVAVTLDAGDVFEGTAVFTLFGGVPEMRVAAALGVDAQALGNHDVAPGASLAALRGEAPHDPLLAANLELEGVDVATSIVVERGGLRVLVIGLGRSPDAVPDVATCAARVQQLLDARGAAADVTVVLSHLGSDLDTALIPRTTGIDVLLGGHTHDVLWPARTVKDCGPALAAERSCRPRAVPLVHSGAYGRYVGRVTLLVSTDREDFASGAPRRHGVVLKSAVGLLPVTEAVVERPDVVSLLEPYRRAMTSAGLDQRVAYAPRAVTRAAVRGGDSALGNLVARAMRVATGADLAVINTTGIRDDLPAGELTVEDVFRVLPFDDRLVTERIKGAALLDAVERIRSASCDRDGESQAQIDGATLRLGCARGQESEVRVGGRAVDPGATYLIATVSFLTQAGRWLEPPTGVTVEDVGVVRDAVLGAIRSLPPCAADAGSPLPCLDARAGAGTDGRIEWQ